MDMTIYSNIYKKVTKHNYPAYIDDGTWVHPKNINWRIIESLRSIQREIEFKVDAIPLRERINNNNN